MLQPIKPFERAETDTYFDDLVGAPCNQPDCAECTWRNRVRKALGSLVEAVTLINDATDAAARIWTECSDGRCTFERDMVLSLCAASAVAETAADRLMTPVQSWKTLPPDWAGREESYLAVEHRRRDAQADAAEQRWTAKVAASKKEGGDGRLA